MVGAPGAYDYGPERCSWLTHHLTNWMGDDGFLRRAHCKIRRHNPEGDTLRIEGTGSPASASRTAGTWSRSSRRRATRTASSRWWAAAWSSCPRAHDGRPPRPRGAGRAPGLPARGPAGGSARPPRVGGARSHPRRRRDPEDAAGASDRAVRAGARPRRRRAGPWSHVGTSATARTGLPVHSLYGGKRLEPTPSHAAGIDVARGGPSGRGRALLHVRVDQRAGHARVRAGGQAGDRAGPAEPPRRRAARGQRADPGFASFVGLYPLPDPPRHDHRGAGAAYHNETRARLRPHGGADGGLAARDAPARTPGCRGCALAEHADADTARVYPGGCLLEGTNLSEGRGTTRPFEWVGAPYLDGPKLAAALERRGLPGVRFRPSPSSRRSRSGRDARAMACRCT